MQFNTEGNEKADEHDKLGADIDEASRVEWHAKSLEDEC